LFEPVVHRDVIDDEPLRDLDELINRPWWGCRRIQSSDAIGIGHLIPVLTAVADEQVFGVDVCLQMIEPTVSRLRADRDDPLCQPGLRLLPPDN